MHVGKLLKKLDDLGIANNTVNQNHPGHLDTENSSRDATRDDQTKVIARIPPTTKRQFP